METMTVLTKLKNDLLNTVKEMEEDIRIRYNKKYAVEDVIKKVDELIEQEKEFQKQIIEKYAMEAYE